MTNTKIKSRTRYKPDSVLIKSGSHLSRITVARNLKQLTRRKYGRAARFFLFALHLMGLVLPVFVTENGGGLLPRLFTLTVWTAVIFCNAFPALLRTDVISHYALSVRTFLPPITIGRRLPAHPWDNLIKQYYFFVNLFPSPLFKLIFHSFNCRL